MFQPWVDECPLSYVSNNAPKKVNAKLLGMRSKVVSDDCARRALQKIDEAEGVRWLQDSLYYCYSPLLSQPWILDSDVTVKPL